jgi:hypothetical protein
MFWANRLACALGVVCLALAGCRLGGVAWDGYVVAMTGEGKVVAASLETSATTVQATLNNLGLTANLSRDGEDVRIASQANGKKFTVVLHREKQPDGDRTRVRIEWEKGVDVEMRLRILADLNVKKK